MKINKDILSAFITVLFISIFSLVIGILFKQNSERQITEILKIQKNQELEKKYSEQREKIADFKRDSALSVLGKQTREMKMMNNNLNSINSNVLTLKGVFHQNFNELKNIKNEKDHIMDASIYEQYDFLSKYRYREYSGNANP